MNKTFDAIIIGGGIIGTGAGYYLSKRGLNVLLIEKDYLTAGSTGRCITGVRQQFSTPPSIKTSMESVKLFREMENEFGFSIEWADSGYLFMAHTQELADLLKKNVKIQQDQGLDVEFISAEECKNKIPLLNTDGLIGGSWCASDGQADPFFVVKGFSQGINKHGGSILTRTQVVDVLYDNGSVTGVKTDDGTVYSSGVVINAAGPWAKEVGAMAGVKVDVEPERHEALITEGVEYLGLPMIVDYRPDGGYFVQRVTGQFIGCFTPETQVPGNNKDSTLEFLKEMSRRMCRLVPALEHVSILRQWAGSYSMTPDGNPLVGETEVKGFYCCCGMCGHGFMLGPAITSFLAQNITEKTWPFDLGEIMYGRAFGEKESMA